MAVQGQHSGSARGRDYRRGTILGFTVAEVFLLLGFALILLLLLTQAIERERTAGAERFHDRFTPAERQLLETAQAEGWVGRLADPTATGELRRIVDARDALAKGARLIEEQDLFAIVDAMKTVPAAEREGLVALVSIGGREDVAAWAREIARLAAAGHGPEDIGRALALLATMEPGEEARIDALSARIRARIALAEAAPQTLAERIRATAGDRIAALGGTIDPVSGTVTLPDVALFGPGSATIGPELARFLDGFCPDWLTLLSGFGARLDRILLEGHASSEWLGAAPGQAFLNNMRLSQERASAVLGRCLSIVQGTPAGAFAQERLVAVGNSSARPILVDGQEDREASRRVVFRVEFDREALIGDITREVDPVR
jgi:outer membrane protein OmpA-like peptidoglycan-associated protein